MGKFVFVILSQFLLIYLQLEVGNLGWPLPLALLGALYTVLALGCNWGYAAALISGSILAALYGGGICSLYVLIHFALAASLSWWIARHNEDIRPDFAMPGVIAGFVSALPAALVLCSNFLMRGVLTEEMIYFLLRTLWSAAVSGGIFMLFILLGELIAEFMGLPRFLIRKGNHKR